MVSFRHRLEYAIFRAGAAIIRALPLETASRLSGKGWRRFAPLTKRHKRALAHIALAFPDMPRNEREEIAREMWENLGRVFAESFHLEEIARSGRIAYKDRAAIEAMLPADRRCVACSLHIGNWEAAAIALADLGGKPAGIYQRIKNPLVDAYVRRLRSPIYPGGLLPKGEAAGRKAMAHVRSGGALATMADLRDWQGPAVPFLGRLAPSTPFPALMARTLGVPLYAGMVAREPRDGEHVRFAVTVVRIEVTRSHDREADVRETTARLQAAFEAFVREKPGQWMWAHRRWG